MLRHLDSDSRRPQMRDVAKKRDRTLAVAIFQLTIRRTHSAQRLNATLDTLCHPRALASTQLAQRMLPCQLDAGPDVEGLLLGNYANAYFATSVNGKRIHPASAKIHGVMLGKGGRALQIATGQAPVLVHTL